MVRFDRPCHNLSGAMKYFAEHMSKAEYLSQGGQLQMIWYGKGAEKLGLMGEVQKEQFRQMCLGRHPETGDKLMVREKANRRICYFAQISVPKDVSIALLVGGDKRIEVWWKDCVQETLREIEAVTQTRVRAKGHPDEDRVTGNIIAATVTHDNSRSLDPQLHTHLCIMNLTYDEVEKRWKSLQPSNFYRYQSFFREVCLNKLAQRMTQGGYELERSRKMGFDIKGFPESARQRFSKRRNQIVAAANELGVTDQDGLQSITSITRKDKEQLTVEQLGAKWKTECGEDLPVIERIIQEARARLVSPISFQPKDALDYAEEHLFERCSVIHEGKLLGEALEFGRGRVELHQLRTELERQISGGSLIRHGDKITSLETLKMESEFIHWARSEWDKYSRMGDVKAISNELSPDHQEAVTKILKCRNRIIVLQGDAGTGKTTSLKEVVKGITASGGSVFACAPSTGATDGLRQEVTSEADTLQQLLVNQQLQEKIANRNIIVDEAGLLSVRQMRDLCRLAKRNNNRLILVGDTKQHNSVEAGDALRALQKYYEVNTVHLKKIIRQKNPAYRKVVEHLANKNPYQAFDQLEGLGEVYEAKNASALYDRATNDYLKTVSSGKSCLVISPVWTEIEEFTNHVRDKLKVENLLANDEKQFLVTSSFGWTKAKRKQVENYKPGDILQFHRQTGVFAKDESVKLVEVKGPRLVVEKENGERYLFNPRRIHDFDVGEEQKIQVATGDKLLIRANLKPLKINNGDILDVAGFNSDGSILLKDGRTLPATFRQFTHGYASTSHAAQGKTVDRGILILGESGIKAANLRQAYVSNSRFRDTQAIYTVDRKRAKDAMATDSDRQLAHELREKRIKDWQVMEEQINQGKAFRTSRQRVIAATQVQSQTLKPGVSHAP